MANLKPGYKHEVHHPFIHAPRPDGSGHMGIIYHFFDSELQARLWMEGRRKGHVYQHRRWDEPHLSTCPIYLYGVNDDA